MSLVSVAARQSRAVVMITALVAAGGVVTGWSLPSDIYPPLKFPRIVVIAHAGITPADSMVLQITRPVEQAVMEVPGIRRVRSKTFRGAAEVSAQFEPATDMVVALQQVQNRISEARADMPPGVDLILHPCHLLRALGEDGVPSIKYLYTDGNLVVDVRLRLHDDGPDG